MEPITNRQGLIDGLRKAATLEHQVICRYLYAAFSLKSRCEEGGVSRLQLETVREWRASLFRVAREEMGHLGLVCNLLTSVGSPAYFEPPRRRGSKLGLRPFSMNLLGEFIRIEREHDPAGQAGSIGAQYARLRRGFESVARSNPLLFVGAPKAQVENESLELPPGWFNINLHAVLDAPSAASAIDLILEESGGSDEAAHAEEFEAVRRSYSELLDAGPAFDPVRDMAEDPSLGEHDMAITHPVTRRAAELFNEAYEVMLMLMLRFYVPASESDEERDVLQKTAFFPLMTMVLRPLGELLAVMPLSEAYEARAAASGAPRYVAAGPTFECRPELALPVETLGAWTLLQERLDELDHRCAGLAAAVERSEETWSRSVQERTAFLSRNLRGIASDFRRRMNTESIQVRHLLKALL